MKPYKAVLFAVMFFVVAGIFLAKNPLCGDVFAFCDAQQSAAPSATPVAMMSAQEIAPGYVEYSAAALQQAQKNGKIVLYFWAPWCSSCTSMDFDLKQGVSKVPDGVTILRVDYDHSPDLKKIYNVVVQHTFVQVDSSGHALTSWVGGDVKDLAQKLVW